MAIQENNYSLRWRTWEQMLAWPNADVRRQRLDYLLKMTREGKQFGTMP